MDRNKDSNIDEREILMKKKILLFNIIAVNFILLTSCNTGVSQKSDKIEINSDYDILSMCNIKEGYDVIIKKDRFLQRCRRCV